MVLLSVAALYAPVRGHAFLNYDDDYYVSENPALARGLSWEGIGWALGSTRGANWFPLTRLSFLAEQDLHGLSAAGVHTTNVLLHGATAVLLFLALLRLTGAALPSAFAAGVFALHPLAVESVAWAAERKGLLCGFFWMLTLRVYAGVGQRPLSPGRGAVTTLCLAACLMSKSVGVTLPFVLLLLDVWPLGRIPLARRAPGTWVGPRRAVLEKLPLFALVAASSVVTFLAQRAAGVTIAVEQLPVAQRFENAAVAYVAYLAHFFWPRGLSVFYPHPEGTLARAAVAGALLLLAAVTALALWQRHRRPWLAVGWLWYLGVLVPMIGLVQVGSQAMADRYAYLPMVGLVIALTWSGAELWRGLPRARPALAAAALLLLAALAVTSRLQLAHWRDNQSLFSHSLAVTTRNHVAHAHLGMALLASGRDREAMAELRESVRIRPDDLEVSNNLAWLLATNPDPVLRDPEEATRLAAAAAKQGGGRNAAALDTLAAAHAAAGRYDRAVWYADRALRLAEARGDAALADAIRARLALYRANQPYREPSTPPPPDR